MKKKIEFSWINLIFASLFYCGGTAIYFMASRYIGSGLAMVLFFTYPMIVILFNCFFGYAQMSKAYLLAILLLVSGLFFLIDTDQLEFDVYGLILAMLSAVSYAAYIIFSKNRIKLPPLTYTFAVSIGSAVIFFILALDDIEALIPSSAETWYNILGMALICTVLPVIFLLESFKSITAERAAVLSVLEPVFVIIAGVTLLGEKVNILQAVGVIVILSAAIVVSLDKPKEIEKNK
jgi:drug/metabolite transporter (DMT)-like permease